MGEIPFTLERGEATACDLVYTNQQLNFIPQ